MGYKYFCISVSLLILSFLLKAQENQQTLLLQGTWFEINEENASFSINDNSVLFLENQSLDVTFKVENDTLYYFFNGEVKKDKIVKLTSDTLILNWKGMVTKYLKK